MPTISEIHAAYERGQPIESRRRFTDDWSICTHPLWNWQKYDYRIAEVEDWLPIPDGFKYVARDLDGSVYAYTKRPTYHELQGRWESLGEVVLLCRLGNCHPRESLRCKT